MHLEREKKTKKSDARFKPGTAGLKARNATTELGCPHPPLQELSGCQPRRIKRPPEKSSPPSDQKRHSGEGKTNSRMSNWVFGDFLIFRFVSTDSNSKPKAKHKLRGRKINTRLKKKKKVLAENFPDEEISEISENEEKCDNPQKRKIFVSKTWPWWDWCLDWWNFRLQLLRSWVRNSPKARLNLDGDGHNSQTASADGGSKSFKS